jgi:Pyridoxamine 5'-phosphate oxidase
MTDRTPIEVTNLDIYGHPALLWSRPYDLLTSDPPPNATYFLGTVQPNGLPHAAAIGPEWFEGDFYFTSNPSTRKARNLAANSACTLSVRLEGIDLVFEGEAHRITDQSTLEQVAKRYRDDGWPAEVKDDAFTAPYMAPSGGPPPWYLYRFTFHTVFANATAAPDGATRWRFDH